jgi:hypothetical protein
MHKWQWDKFREATGALLHRSSEHHVLGPMLWPFDTAEHYGDI